MKEELVKFGNVIFSEEGISIQMPHKALEKDLPRLDVDKCFEELKEFVAGRLKSCEDNLNKNYQNILASNKNGILFKDGSRFSVPAAQAMERILATDSIVHFDEAMYIQASKSLIDNKVIVNDVVIPACRNKTNIMNFLLDEQMHYNNCRLLSAQAGFLTEFDQRIEAGDSPSEALREWDI